MSNGQIKHYCLKLLEKTSASSVTPSYSLGLEECYYCMMYYVKYCSFVYDSTDSYGHKFKIGGGSDQMFYIPKDFDTTTNKVSFLSIENEELDYSKDIQSIQSNSTMLDAYKVNNVFSASSLDYWSSKLYKKGSCPVVEIQIVFEKMIVVKSILIDWVKVPNSFSVKFCQQVQQDSNSQQKDDANPPQSKPKQLLKNCYLKEYTKDSIENFHSELRRLYVKSNIMILNLYPQNSMEENSSIRFCIFSIKQIRVFRNEIHVEPEIITINHKDNFIYNYNFFLTRVHDLKLQSLQSSNNLQMFSKIEKIIENIKKLKKVIDGPLRNKVFVKLVILTYRFLIL